jgi:carboxypeptidase C (cathepsin A)
MSEEAAPAPVKLVEEEFVVTQHKFGEIETEVTAGCLPLKNDQGEIDALVFFIAYCKKNRKKEQERPLMFVFNGGPGSPAIWLHMGALGPKRAPMMPDGTLPAPPYELKDNPHHWLDMFDLVFIDPVGTGYSRAKDEKTGEKYWGLKGDIESMTEFIRLWLARFEASESPIYLCGESYGTTRAAGLAAALTDKGIFLNGIVLVSSVLNFQTLEFRKGNDLPYALFLPTYAATAHYHGRVQGELSEVVEEARAYALGDYWLALAKGTGLSLAERRETAEKLSSLIGVSPDYLLRCGLRPVIHEFCKELLREEGKVVGRLDSRIKAVEDAFRGHAAIYESDPSMNILMGPYVSLFSAYVRRDLGWKTDLEYQIFGGIKKDWDWGSARSGYPDTSDALRRAMGKNPYMKVFVASGLYDLATPFFATEYTLSHMGLDDSLAGKVIVREYEAGHMMYIHEDCLKKLSHDIGVWQVQK